MHSATSSSSDSSAAAGQEAVEEGQLGPITVPELLALAWRDRRSGVLQLVRGQAERQIQVADGLPTGIVSSAADDGFAQMLESTGLIAAADRLKVEALARKQACPQTSAVLALRLIDAQALYKAMRGWTRSQIAETFEWQTGEFRWVASADDDPPSGKPHDILNLLQQQLPTRWGSDRLFEALMPHAERCGDISPRLRRVAEKLAAASDPARRAVERLDGQNPIGQILGETAGDPVAASTLWTLLHAGILRVCEQRARRTQDDAAPEIAFEFEVAAAAPAAAARASSRSKSADEKTAAQSDKAQTLRTEIASLLETLSDLNHYDALGLTTEATSAKIKRAYFKAAKKFHPDTLAGLGLDDVRDDAARVFGRIAEAFETLSDENKRAAYDAGGSDEPEIDTARLAQAETSFRKGEILVRMGNFQGALEYLESAVDLWPEEPAYQSTLGWALYKQPQRDAERARVHLEQAVAQSKDDAVILFRLGVVIRSLGGSDEADALIARARQLQPDIDE